MQLNLTGSSEFPGRQDKKRTSESDKPYGINSSQYFQRDIFPQPGDVKGVCHIYKKEGGAYKEQCKQLTKI